MDLLIEFLVHISQKDYLLELFSTITNLKL